jgi:hypothetical protein
MWAVFEGTAIFIQSFTIHLEPEMRVENPDSDCVRVACIEYGTHNKVKGKGHPVTGHEGLELE